MITFEHCASVVSLLINGAKIARTFLTLFDYINLKNASAYAIAST
jgi:hypothetical protein